MSGLRPLGVWLASDTLLAGSSRSMVDSSMAMDTSSEAAELRRAFLAAMSGEERLQAALELSEAVASLAEAGSRARAASGSTTMSIVGSGSLRLRTNG